MIWPVKNVASSVAMIICWLICFVPAVGNCAQRVSEEIIRASRFERWTLVLDLAKNLSIRESSDIPAGLAAIDACASLRCTLPLDALVKGSIVSGAMREFFLASQEAITENPRQAKERFIALSSDANFGWLGHYGLLELSIASGNARFLSEAIESAMALKHRPKMLEVKLVLAQQVKAQLTHDHKASNLLLERYRDLFTPGEWLTGKVNVLILMNDLLGAAQLVKQYVSKHGYDHDAAEAEVSVFSYQHDTSWLLAHVDKRLSQNPTYWRLLLARAQYLVEINRVDEAIKLLSDDTRFPSGLMFARLQRLRLLVTESGAARKEFLQSLPRNTADLDDFTEFHVVAAKALMEEKSFDLARMHLNRIDFQTSSSVTAGLLRAAIARNEKNYREAVSLTNRLVKLLPHEVELQIALVQALILAGDRRAADDWLTKIRSSRRYVPVGLIRELEKR